MPAIMINPVVGGRLIVTGNRIASVAGGPRPGRMPTRVPITTPTATQNRFIGVNADANPPSRFCTASIRSPSAKPPWQRVDRGVSWALEEGRRRQFHAEDEPEQRVGDERHGDDHQHSLDAL